MCLQCNHVFGRHTLSHICSTNIESMVSAQRAQLHMRTYKLNICTYHDRASKLDKQVAGIQAIEGFENQVVENIDVSGVVGGHWDYRLKLGELVKLVGLSSGQLPPRSLMSTMLPSLTGQKHLRPCIHLIQCDSNKNQHLWCFFQYKPSQFIFLCLNRYCQNV